MTISIKIFKSFKESKFICSSQIHFKISKRIKNVLIKFLNEKIKPKMKIFKFKNQLSGVLKIIIRF